MNISKYLFELRNKAEIINDDIHTLQKVRIDVTLDLTILRLDFLLDEESDFLLYEIELDMLSDKLSKIAEKLSLKQSYLEATLETLENFRI